MHTLTHQHDHRMPSRQAPLGACIMKWTQASNNNNHHETIIQPTQTIVCSGCCWEMLIFPAARRCTAKNLPRLSRSLAFAGWRVKHVRSRRPANAACVRATYRCAWYICIEVYCVCYVNMRGWGEVVICFLGRERRAECAHIHSSICVCVCCCWCLLVLCAMLRASRFEHRDQRKKSRRALPTCVWSWSAQTRTCAYNIRIRVYVWFCSARKRKVFCVRCCVCMCARKSEMRSVYRAMDVFSVGVYLFITQNEMKATYPPTRTKNPIENIARSCSAVYSTDGLYIHASSEPHIRRFQIRLAPKHSTFKSVCVCSSMLEVLRFCVFLAVVCHWWWWRRGPRCDDFAAFSSWSCVRSERDDYKHTHTHTFIHRD